MQIKAALFLTIIVHVWTISGADEQLKKHNTHNTLKTYLTNSLPHTKSLGLDEIDAALTATYKEHSHGPLKNNSACESLRELLLLFPKKLVYTSPVDENYGLTLQELALRDFGIKNYRIRKEFLEEKPDYDYLLENTHHIDFHTAHKALCDYLLTAPSSDSDNHFRNIYFKLLTLKEQSHYLDSFLQNTLASSPKQRRTNFFAFSTIARTSVRNKLPDAVKRICDAVCTTKNIIDAVHAVIHDPFGLSQEITTIFSTAPSVTATQALILAHTKKDAHEALERLALNPKAFPVFIGMLKKLITVPEWQKTTGKLLWHTFSNNTHITLQTALSDSLLQQSQKKIQDPLLHLSLLRAEYAKLKNTDKKAKEIKERLEQELCALNTKNLTDEQHAYVDNTFFSIFMDNHKTRLCQKNLAVFEKALNAGFDRFLKAALSAPWDNKYFSQEKILDFLDKKQDQLSPTQCYHMGIFCVAKEQHKKAYDWFERASIQGDMESLIIFTAYAGGQKDILKLHKTITAAIKINPHDPLINICKDLVYLRMIGGTISEKNPQGTLSFCNEFFTKYDSIEHENDPRLCFYTTAGRAFARTLNPESHPFDAFDHKAILRDLRDTHIQYALYDGSTFHPFVLMPEKAVNYCEKVIEQAVEENNFSPEQVATALLALNELHTINCYHETKILYKGIRHLLTITGNAKPESNTLSDLPITYPAWYEKNSSDLGLLMLSLFAYESSLADFIAKASFLDAMSLTVHDTYHETEKSIGIDIKNTSLYKSLYDLAMQDSEYAYRAQRILLRFNICKDFADKLNFLAHLCSRYQGNDIKKHTEAIMLFEKTIRDAELEKRLSDCNTILQNLKDGNYKKEDREFLSEKIKNTPGWIYFLLQAGLDTIDPDPAIASVRESRVLLSLQQVRGFIAQKENPTELWLTYSTSQLKEFVWKSAEAKSHEYWTQMDFDLRAFAAILNMDTKTDAERIALLQPGTLHNAFCSLLYALHIIDGRPISAIPTWKERSVIYENLKYAILQGQKLSRLARDIDPISQEHAQGWLKKNFIEGDLGSAITLASTEVNPIEQAATIINTNFLHTPENMIKGDEHLSDLLTFAGTNGILTNLGRIAKTESLAQAALFRIYAEQAHKISTNKDTFAPNMKLIENVVSYGSKYYDIQKGYAILHANDQALTPLRIKSSEAALYYMKQLINNGLIHKPTSEVFTILKKQLEDSIKNIQTKQQQ